MDKRNKKFRPCKNYRYLPGSVSDEVNNIDLAVYNRHRYRVFTAKATVDDNPLKMNPYNLFNIRQLRKDIIRLRQIDMENKNLLKKINMINRKGGKVDSYNPWAYRKIDKWPAHRKKMKKIEVDNKEIYQSIMKTVSYYQVKNLATLWKSTLGIMEHSCRYPLVILKNVAIDETLKAQPSISKGLEKGKVERPLCFLDFQVKNGENLGRMIIELYYDHVPVTVQNFLEICRGKENLSYRNCIVHRIIKGQYLETGDITDGNGRGGCSIYGKSFQEENHMLKHSKAGVLSMKRLAPTDNNSQFCITFTKMDGLDHKNVVFGKVIKGNETLFKIQDYGRKIGKPHAEIIISGCGELTKIKS